MSAHGVEKAVTEMRPGEGIAEAVAGGDQAELFAEIAEGEREAVGEIAWSGKGRKPGARNKVTADILAYLQRFTRDPLISLASINNMTPAEIRAHFGVTKGKEVFDIWFAVRKTLAEYMHSKQPIGLRVESRRYEPVHISFGIAAEPDIDGAARELDEAVAAIMEIKQNQSLSKPDAAMVSQIEGLTDE